MTTIKAPKGEPRELPIVGTHQAVCVKVIDEGTQPGTPQYPEEKRKYALIWEYSDEFTSKGQPHEVMKEYTFIDSDKSILRGDWNSLFPSRTKEDIVMNDFLGASGLITVAHKISKKNTPYAVINTVVALPKGMTPKRPQARLEELHLIEGAFNVEVFNKLPKFIKDKIEASQEYKDLTAVGAPPAPPAEQKAKAKQPAKAAPAKAAPAKKKR